MKKVLSLAIATMFAFAVSAQTTIANKPKSETQKVEKTSSTKMSMPEKKEEVKKTDSPASSANDQKAHLAKQHNKVKPHVNHAKHMHPRKSNQRKVKVPSENKTEKSIPIVK